MERERRVQGVMMHAGSRVTIVSVLLVCAVLLMLLYESESL